nr:hypothetical protein [Achromobacter ruhlandii]
MSAQPSIGDSASASPSEAAAVEKALGNSNPDLSAGGLSANQAERISLATQESAHRINQQQTIFSSLLSLIVLLYLIGAVFSGVALYLAAQGVNKVDWHTWLLGLAFIVPPTVLSIVLVRASYYSNSTQDKGDASDNLPALSLVKEIAKACTEAVKASKAH